MTPCSVPPPRQAAASWRLDLHPGCQDTRQRPWPASFTHRELDRSSAFLWLPVGRLPAGSQLGRVVLKQLFLQPPTQRRTLAKAPERCPSPPPADGRELRFVPMAESCLPERACGMNGRPTGFDGWAAPLRSRSVQRSPKRRPPRCPGSARSIPAWNVPAATARRASSSCAGRSTSPWSGASSACRSRRNRGRATRPSLRESARTVACPDVASRGCGSGTESLRTSTPPA